MLHTVLEDVSECLGCPHHISADDRVLRDIHPKRDAIDVQRHRQGACRLCEHLSDVILLLLEEDRICIDLTHLQECVDEPLDTV